MASTPPLRIFGRLAAAVLARARLATATATVLLLVAIAAATQIRLDFSSTAFYGAGDPAAAALERFVARWGADDATLYVIAEADPPGVLEPATTDALAALRRALERDPGVEEVRSLEALLASPAVPLLLSADGTRTVLAVRLRQSSDDVQAITPVVERLTARVAEHDGAGGLRLTTAGVPAIRAGFYALALGDQLRLGPLVGLTLALLLALAFRRVHGVAVPLVLAGVPVAGLVGVMAATDEPIGLLNQAFFTLLPVIAVADAVHLVSRFHEILRREGADPRDAPTRRAAVLEACDRTGAACLLTSVTTGLGFASLALAQMPMLRRFGLYAAAGIALAYLALLMLGPLLLDRARARPPAASRGMPRLARWTARRLRPAWVVGLTLGLAGLAALGARQVQIDNYLTALLSPSHPVRQASAELDRTLGGTLALEVELVAARSWRDPEPLAALREFERWAADQLEVRAVTGPATLADALPLASTPAAASLNAEVLRDDDRRARIRLHTADIGGRAFARLADRVTARAAALPARVTVTGTPLLAYRGVNRIAAEIQQSLVGLALVVTLVIALLLRSLRLALVALLPNVMPLAVAYAALGVLGIELDPLAAIILCVALGIAVDDSLHLLARFDEERAQGLAPAEALERAVAHSGQAALVTTVALVGGLALNLASSFPPLRLLGGLGAATIALAWVFDVLVLPGLLRAARADTAPPRA